MSFRSRTIGSFRSDSLRLAASPPSSCSRLFYRLAFAHRLRVPGGRTRQPRLGLVDAFSLDGQRQLVLVRRDNIEHLVMIGGPNDVLVESQINRAVAPARESNQASPLLVPSTPVRRTEAAALACVSGRRKRRRRSPPRPRLRRPRRLRLRRTAAPAAPTVGRRADRGDRSADPATPESARAAAAPASAQASIPAQRPRPNRRGQPLRCAARRKRRSPPDQRRRVRRRVRRSRVPRNRARRCPRRSSPPTPRRTAGRRFAPRKRRPREARAIPRPRLLSRLRRRAARRNRSRRSRLESGVKPSQR